MNGYRLNNNVSLANNIVLMSDSCGKMPNMIVANQQQQQQAPFLKLEACHPSTSLASTSFGSPPPVLTGYLDGHGKTQSENSPPQLIAPGMNGNSSYNSQHANQQQQMLALASQQPLCARCAGPIHDRFLLKAADKFWHESCLRCDVCNCLLNESNKSLFVKNDKIYCRRDYGQLFGVKGQCSACRNVIPAYEMIMRAAHNVYHLDCFSCQECNHRFCVGDTFYFDVDNNKILCEYDYKERIYFAKLSPCNLVQLRKKMDHHMNGVDLSESILPNRGQPMRR